MEKNDNCTVLLASCDKYADLLGPFSAQWRKFWPDCPFEVVLVTESEPDLSVRGLPPFRTRFVEGVKALVFAIFPASLIVRIQNALGSGAKEKCV